VTQTETGTIAVSDFRTAVADLTRETFESVEGYYLDKGTSLYETLEAVTAGKASRAASDRVASLAAQVDHLGYYIEVLLAHLCAGGQDDSLKADWDAAWQRTSVTEDEWRALQARLRNVHRQFVEFVSANEDWSEDILGGIMSINVHTAYHLGEIRQALGVIEE
jgi:hypothetical protein